MSTITQEQAEKITAYLASHTLPSGLGTEESACSIAAINLALTGKLTDKIPACMSPVIGRWIIRIQDAMPDDMRNSNEWKRLLPLAAGTGREFEPQRKAVAMEWMWTVVLTQLQPLADKRGYGDAWLRMTTEKTQEAALGAKKAAYAYAAAHAAAAAAAAGYAAGYADAYADAAAAAAGYAAAHAAAAAAAAGYAAGYADAYAAAAADAAGYADAYADAAGYADAYADAAAAAAGYAARNNFWIAVNPCKCLADMIAVSA